MNSVLYQRNTLCKTCQRLLLISLGQKILFSWAIWSQTDRVKSSWSFGPNWSWLKATRASRTQISLFCPCWFEAFAFYFISPAAQRFSSSTSFSFKKLLHSVVCFYLSTPTSAFIWPAHLGSNQLSHPIPILHGRTALGCAYQPIWALLTDICPSHSG